MEQDDETAALWYRKAAEQDNAAAQFNLGLLCLNGRGVPQNMEQAAEWFRRSAELGDSSP